MNIKDAIEEKIEGDYLISIFNRQKELMSKYHNIETRSGLCQTEDCPVNLDDKYGQARIKDFAWRTTEELGEALDSIINDRDETHFKEELVDGLHFLTELTILSGYTPEKIYKTVFDKEYDEENDILISLYDFCIKENDCFSLSERIVHFICDLGMACNCLKNKPWKQTNMITDKEIFYKKLVSTWISYITILSCIMDPDEIVSNYLKKSQVNKFRQRSGY